MRLKITGVLTSLCISMAPACERSHHKAHTPPSITQAEASAGYGPGPWRLARHQIGDVAFNLRHILVTHQHSESEDNSNFRGPNWSAERKSSRTIDEARELAAKIAAEAGKNPTRFGELAERYSDDLVTNKIGGQLGVWEATLLPETFLDALGELRPGDTSRVIPSALGFHILSVEPLPAEHQIAAKRILVGYSPTANIVPRKGHTTARTREEALAIASTLRARLETNPEAFDELVEEFSDHSDALIGGYVGQFSIHRSFPYNVELAVLSELEIGQVTQPIDGREGVAIYRREPITPAQPIAVQEIVVTKASLASADGIKTLADLASSLQANVDAHPERFATYQKKYCCEDARQWLPGRGLAALERAVRVLEIGELAPHPIAVDDNDIRILRRVAPKPEPKLAAVHPALPRPTTPDVDALIGHAGEDGEALGRYAVQLLASAREELDLSDQQSRQLTALTEQLASDLSQAEPAQRARLLAESRTEMTALLGDSDFNRLRTSVRRRLAADLVAQ